MNVAHVVEVQLTSVVALILVCHGPVDLRWDRVINLLLLLGLRDGSLQFVRLLKSHLFQLDLVLQLFKLLILLSGLAEARDVRLGVFRAV